jgi:hypothetical protein
MDALLAFSFILSRLSKMIRGWVCTVPRSDCLLRANSGHQQWLGLEMEASMRRLSLSAVPVLALAAAVLPTRADALSLRFSWVDIPACSSMSPAFELGGVPVGTKRLSFMMTDLKVPTFHHGGSIIAYDGDAVRRGAIRYIGPCPPRGEHHNYRWTVQALDAAGKVLDRGSAEAVFPP